MSTPHRSVDSVLKTCFFRLGLSKIEGQVEELKAEREQLKQQLQQFTGNGSVSNTATGRAKIMGRNFADNDLKIVDISNPAAPSV